ncbi:MAG: DUF2752 domain-containing protein [Nocardioides sp.]
MTSTALPLRDERSRWRRVQAPVVVAVALLAASVALHLRDPHRSGSWGICPWLALTGTSCPGCGGLRAVNDLTHGDLVWAASSNLLFVGSIPLLAVWWTRRTVDGWRGVRRQVPERTTLLVTYGLLSAAVVFWVLRNLPFAGWLAP